MAEHELVFYQIEMCSYCHKVRRYIAKHDIQLPTKNTRRDPNAREELIRLGGKGQVPALMIDGEVLYESNAIIEWLERNVVQARVMRQK